MIGFGTPRERPEDFQLNPFADMARGLVLAGLGRLPGTTHFEDDSLYGNHGVLTNMDPATDWVWSNELGRWCQGYDDTYTNIPKKSIFDSVPFSISVWFQYTDTPANFGSVFCKIITDSRISGWGATYGYSRMRFCVQNALDYVAYNDFSSDDREWHSFVGVFDGTTSRSYLDGVPGTTSKPTYTSQDSDIRIGRGKYAATAKIADAMYFNRALTPSEIAQLADPSNVMLSGLIQPPRRRLWAVTSGAAPPATNRRRRLIIAA